MRAEISKGPSHPSTGFAATVGAFLLLFLTIWLRPLDSVIDVGTRTDSQLGNGLNGNASDSLTPSIGTPALTLSGNQTSAAQPVQIASLEHELVDSSVFKVSSVLNTLKKTGRHGWRHHAHKANRNAQKIDEELSSDRHFFLTLLTVVLIIHTLIFQLTSTTALHVIGLLIWLAVGVAYGLVVFARKGEDKGVMWMGGYMLEFLNMMENVCIFQSIAKSFDIPRNHTRKMILTVMFWQALVHTILFTDLADWLRHLRFLSYLVGSWLVYTGIQVFRHHEDKGDEGGALIKARTIRFMHQVLGDRFCPSYDKGGNMLIVTKTGDVALSLLGPVICIFMVLDFFLELDVILTKIEEIPNLHLAYTSSVVATFVMPDLFFVASKLFQRFFTLQYGIGVIVTFFGLEMLASDVVVIPALANSFVMMSVIVICMLSTTCLKAPDTRIPVATAEEMTPYELLM